jgi:hypothetical protein
MYFVLAAQRLAALVRMIRNYDPRHRQHRRPQPGLPHRAAGPGLPDGRRPPHRRHPGAHPPALRPRAHLPRHFSSGGGKDPAMEQLYASLAACRPSAPGWTPSSTSSGRGRPAARRLERRRARPHAARRPPQPAWEPGEDRDNRGKVYLYFCPEDMTVALRNVQGIGWQGVPDQLDGRHPAYGPWRASARQPPPPGQAQAAAGTRPRFLQRVFTKSRATWGARPPPSGRPRPCHFTLRLEGEPDKDHVRPTSPPCAPTPEADPSRPTAPAGRRFINGEPLPKPYPADLYAGALSSTPRPRAASWRASTPSTPPSPSAATRARHPRGAHPRPPPRQAPAAPLPRRPAAPRGARAGRSPGPAQRGQGRGRPDQAGVRHPRPDGQLDIERRESPNEARLRYQNDTSPRSFHSAIWASKANHAHVTAYDIAVGRGRAVSDKAFYAYLCAVADWRLKEPAR